MRIRRTTCKCTQTTQLSGRETMPHLNKSLQHSQRHGRHWTAADCLEQLTAWESTSTFLIFLHAASDSLQPRCEAPWQATQLHTPGSGHHQPQGAGGPAASTAAVTVTNLVSPCQTLLSKTSCQCRTHSECNACRCTCTTCHGAWVASDGTVPVVAWHKLCNTTGGPQCEATQCAPPSRSVTVSLPALT
jgi:hypothetical protein